MARDDPEFQVVQRSQRNRDLLIAIPVASGRRHLHPTAVHLPEHAVQILERRSPIALECSRLQISTERPRRGTDNPRHPHPGKGQSHPVLITPVPYGCNELLIPRANPPESLGKVPVGLSVHVTRHRSVPVRPHIRRIYYKLTNGWYR